MRSAGARVGRIAVIAMLLGSAGYGGYSLLHRFQTRVVSVCVLSDVEHRIVYPDWESRATIMLAQVNRMFEGAGVVFRMRAGGDAYAPVVGGNMKDRWEALQTADCKADVLVGLTGRPDASTNSVATPFSHGVLVKDAGTNEAPIVAAVLARALANLFGAPVSMDALVSGDAAQSGIFDAASIDVIRRLRDYDFSRGGAALTGAWENRAVAALEAGFAGRSRHPGAEAHRIVARGFTGARLHERAVAHLREATRLDPTNRDLQFELAIALHANAESDAALATLKQAAVIDPSYALTYAAIGSICLNAGRLDEAIEAWRKATDLEPGNLTYRAALGQSLALRPGRIQEAGAVFQESLKIRPSDLSALAGLDYQTVAAAQLLENARSIEAETRFAGESAEGHVRLGRAFGFAGQLDRARREIERALAMEPRNGRAHLAMAEIAYLQGDYAKARREAAVAKGGGVDVPRTLSDGIQRNAGGGQPVRGGTEREPF